MTLTKKEQLLEACEELFAEFGYDGTSIRMLAKKAGVNVAMVSYYFGSKEQMFAELVEYRASVLRTRLQDINRESDDPIAKLEQLIDVYVDRIMEKQRFHKIILRQVSINNHTFNQTLIDVIMKNVEEMRKIIFEGIEKGVFKKVEPEYIIITITGIVSHCSNATPIIKRLFNLDQEKPMYENKEVIDGLKDYMKSLLKSYLLK